MINLFGSFLFPYLCVIINFEAFQLCELINMEMRRKMDECGFLVIENSPRRCYQIFLICLRKLISNLELGD